MTVRALWRQFAEIAEMRGFVTKWLQGPPKRKRASKGWRKHIRRTKATERRGQV